MTLRPDLALIAAHVPAGARVLDIGCGDGALLDALRRTKGVDGRGMELDPARVSAAVARGLAVIQGDAEADLADYPADAFDYAILSQTIQAMRAPAAVLREMARIAAHIIVSFPNFGHWKVRAALSVTGRMPVTRALPVSWHETANIHFCTVRDFEALAGELGFSVIRRQFLSRGRPIPPLLANLQAESAIFELSRR